MEKQYLQAYVEKAETDGTLQVAVASDETVDREGEVVKAEGWDLTSFKKNPVFLWSHNAGFGEQRPPIGKVTNLKLDGKKLTFKPIFDMADEFAADIFRKFKDGFLNAFSVGFIPLERDPKDASKIIGAELLEISAVNVPANPKALVSLRMAGLPIAKSFDDWKKGNIEYPDLLSQDKLNDIGSKLQSIEEKITRVEDTLTKPVEPVQKKAPEPKIFSDQDFIDTMKLLDKTIELGLKKAKLLRGGGNK